MLKLFSRRKSAALRREITPQFTPQQLYSLRYAQPPGGLPYSVYDEMEQDSMVQTALSVKRQGILAAPYRIVPASDSDRARQTASFVERQFERMEGSPHTILLGAMDAFAKGWSIQELVWSAGVGEVRLETVKPKDPSLFGLEMDRYGNVDALSLQIPGEPPRELPREKFAIYLNRRSYARPLGKSDLDAAYRHWNAKRGLLSSWSRHLERFGSPSVLGRHDPGLTAEEQDDILFKLSRLAEGSTITLPNDVSVDTVGGQRETSTGFIDAIDFHNREIARSVLGQTLTTDEGRRVGSLALGKVHLQTLLLQLEALRREMADVVMTEQVIRPMVELNFGPGEAPKFEFEPVALSAFATGELR